MADVLNFNVNRVFDINGDPVPGAKAYFFNAGTTSAREVYADPDGAVPHPTPLVADSEGVFPPVYSTGGNGVSVQITDEDDVMLDGYPMPLVIRVPGEGFNASSVAFNPTGDIPSTNVQAAIERVQANLVAPLAAFGLGVTGNGPLLTNINALDIPSGMYRYEASTAGTFPPGVTNTNGGVITIWRRSNDSAIMLLYKADTNTVYMRRQDSTGFVAWVQVYYVTSTPDQARAGTDNTTHMSPLGVEQHMLANDLGQGQTRQNVKANRVDGTWYTNNTGRPITVNVVFSSDGSYLRVSPNGGTTSIVVGGAGPARGSSASVVVYNGESYMATNTEAWVELR